MTSRKPWNRRPGLCEAAEKNWPKSPTYSAFHQLQKLHQEFRAIGPVAKDLREEIWSCFKAASTVVNKRHQQHFEELKEKEQNNLDQKTVICEIVEGMEYDTFTTLLTGKTRPMKSCPPGQMENHRLCSAKDERQDFRTFPRCLR